MNPTDEFILDAFKQQGMLSEEVLAEITAEVEAEGERSLEVDIAHIDSVLGPEVEPSVRSYGTARSRKSERPIAGQPARVGPRHRFRSSTLFVMAFAYLMNI